MSNGVAFRRKLFVRRAVSALQGLQFTRPIMSDDITADSGLDLLAQDIGQVFQFEKMC